MGGPPNVGLTLQLRDFATSRLRAKVIFIFTNHFAHIGLKTRTHSIIRPAAFGGVWKKGRYEQGGPWDGVIQKAHSN